MQAARDLRRLPLNRTLCNRPRPTWRAANWSRGASLNPTSFHDVGDEPPHLNAASLGVRTTALIVRGLTTQALFNHVPGATL